MVKRGLLVFFLGILAVSFGPQFAWGAKVTQAPPIKAVPIIGESYPDVCRSSWSSGGLTEDARLDSVGPEGDPEAGRSVLGTAGKNIWVCPGYDTILVIYGQPSGDPNNIFYLWMAYSYDGGVNWENAASTIGPGASRRIYPGVITPANATVPYIAYQHAENDGTNYTLSDVYFSYDEFFPFMLYTPVRVGADDPADHAWLPSIATTAAGDTVLIAWQNGVTGTITGNCYLKRSFDGGLTWTESEILMVNTQGNPTYVSADTPRMQMGQGGYIFALFNWEETGTARFIPFYTESSDYGATWSVPQMVWPSWPPYADAKCWWYCYDVVLDPADNYRPHCAIKLGTADYEFGDVWECHPTSGSPGSWGNWVTNLLIGDGAGGNYATQPSIGMDANGDLGITFSAFFIHGPGDTSADVGICKSRNQGATWSAGEPVTHDGIVETCIELASQFGDVDESLHGIYDRERDNCQSVWHFFGWTGVEESQEARSMNQETRLYQNHPNPLSQATTIRYQVSAVRSTAVSLAIYDLTGRLVKGLVNGEREPGLHEVVWDGKAENGSPAPAGVYFYRLRAGSYTEAKKLVVLR